MSCFSSAIKFFVKYALVIFNILCLIFGILLIVSGSIMLKELGDTENHIPILIIITGALIFVVAFFGCCGACFENKVMTWTYIVIMAVILCCQVSLVLYIWVGRGELKNFMITVGLIGAAVQLITLILSCALAGNYKRYRDDPIPVTGIALM